MEQSRCEQASVNRIRRQLGTDWRRCWSRSSRSLLPQTPTRPGSKGWPSSGWWTRVGPRVD